MTKAKYDNPRSKVQARSDHPSTLIVTVPAKIAFLLGIRAGDSVEWVKSIEGYDTAVKVRKVIS